MSQDYNEYLAVHVLNEQQYVSYRNLSRALKVHCNLAKQMLYDFHRKQNSKKVGSVHATYLITGFKRAVQQTNGSHSQDDTQDSGMQSSPPLPSSSIPKPDDESGEKTSVKTIMLVKEEDLDQAKELFETITGVHVYSLQANTLKDLQVLTECNRRIAAEYASEDPLKEWRQYGTIQNASVRRRTGKRPPATTAPSVNPEAVKAKAAKTAAAKSSEAEVNSASNPSTKPAAVEQSNSLTTKPAATKKQGSNIFKSFAKGAAKPKGSNSQQNSKGASPAPVPDAEPEDVPMTGFSDDDDDDAESGLSEDPEETKAAFGKSKIERTAELEAMMDQEDEPMEDAAAPAESHDEGALDQTESHETAEPKETVTVENSRRRGRRRVMKKKTVKDEEGYLVTREEAAWESFSEDEPAAKKPKVQVPASNNAAAVKKGAKPGQGKIMSFFSKK